MLLVQSSMECTPPYQLTGISNLLQPAQAVLVLSQRSMYLASWFSPDGFSTPSYMDPSLSLPHTVAFSLPSPWGSPPLALGGASGWIRKGQHPTGVDLKTTEFIFLSL